jgi:hypothetical protein
MPQEVQIIRRIRDLGAAGLSHEAIARVVELDYGQRPTMHLVKSQVRRGAKLGPRGGLAGVAHGHGQLKGVVA